MKIALATYPPFVNACWRTCKRARIIFEFVKISFEKNHLSCLYTSFPLSSKPNETWDALVRTVHDGIYDTTTPTITTTVERSQTVDFGDTVLFVRLLFVIRMSPETRLSMSKLLALDWKVWICLFTCTVIIGVILTMTELGKIGKKIACEVTINTLNALALFTNQNQEMNLFRTGTRILLVFWAISALVVSGVYSGNLLSFLLKNELDYPFKNFGTFIECIERQQCQLVVPAASSYSMTMMMKSMINGQNGRFKRVFGTNRILEIPDLEILTQKVIDTKDRYLVWLTTDATFAALTDNNKLCQFYSIDSGLSDRYHFPIRKNFTTKKLLDVFTMHLQNSGTHRKIYESYVDVNPISSCTSDIDEGTPMAVSSVLSLLFILLIGYGISSFIFGFEKFMK